MDQDSQIKIVLNDSFTIVVFILVTGDGVDPDAELILKAQVHAGGRGKGSFDSGLKGGVQICDTCVSCTQCTDENLSTNY